MAAASRRRASHRSPTTIALVLKPTDHPRVPRDLSQLWMAPEKGRVRSAAQANLATALKMESEGNHAKALALLSKPATAQQGRWPLTPSTTRGLAPTPARPQRRCPRHISSAQSKPLAGFLVEGPRCESRSRMRRWATTRRR